jgi:HK97 family phage prohead protease
VTDIITEARGYRTELEVSSVGRYQYLEGRAVPYGTWADVGLFLEQHAAGSFQRSTSNGSGKPGLPLLLFHDNAAFPVGKAEKWEHSVDGLYGVWKLDDGDRAQEAARMAESGMLTGLSVGFMPVHSAWEFTDEFAPELGAAHKDRVTRTESRLLEVSMTPTPAFADAEVTLVRSAFDAVQRRAMRPERQRDVDVWRDVVEELRSGQR